jgi:hypothetical protein
MMVMTPLGAEPSAAVIWMRFVKIRPDSLLAGVHVEGAIMTFMIGLLRLKLNSRPV